MPHVTRSGSSGQATVELALALPFVALLLAALVEVGVLARNHALVWHAAREAGRIAAVEPESGSVEQAARRSGLAPLEVAIDTPPEERIAGRPIRVTVSYHHDGRVPVLGYLFQTEIEASASMRIERP